MASNIMQINKELIPYSFSLLLSEREYDFSIFYNRYVDSFTMSLALNGQKLVSEEKINLAIPLFEAISHDSFNNRNENFFDEILVAYDLSFRATKINYENFYSSVFIYILNRNEVITDA